MNSKEAIEFMNENISDFEERTEDEELFNKNECEKFIKKAKEVVLSLQRGEKFEKMWGELEDSLEDENPDYPDDIGDYNAILFMKAIKQKYFPKEVKYNEIFI